MKKLVLFLSALTIFGLLTAPAASAEVNLAVANCNGHTVVAATYVRDYGDGAPVGAIQLCRSGYNYFAIYINYGTMPAGRFANAFLYRYLDGVWHNDDNNLWNCDSSGGNDHVLPGQTWCVTPTIYAPSSRVTFSARGLTYWRPSGTWTPFAEGWTIRAR